jgi:hypothetical protein
MFESIIPSEIDSFLNPFKASLHLQILEKTEAYGFDFYQDSPLNPAQRYRWSDGTDQLQSNPVPAFAKQRLIEAEARAALEASLMSIAEPSSTRAYTDLKIESARKRLSFDADCRDSLARSSTSTQTTDMGQRGRCSTSPFEEEWDEDYLEI